MKLIDNLMKTGLTKHESELYVALCKDGDLNGYEAAKASGIPRSNTYQALAGLVEKGAAYMIDGTVQRYTAVPVSEYCKNVMRHMDDVVKEILMDCPTNCPKSEPYITITGIEHIIDKMKNIIVEAKERVYISAAEKEIGYVLGELSEALKRGLKVVVITSYNIDLQGAIVYSIHKRFGQVRLIADTAQVLTGEILGNGNDACLYSINKPLVELIKDSLTNEIKIAEIK